MGKHLLYRHTYCCRLYDGWKPLCFHHATRVSHGPGGNLSRAPLPVVSTDPRGWYKRLQGRLFCGILTENAGKLFQLCHIVCGDTITDDAKSQRGIRHTECSSELVSKFSATLTAEPIFLERIECMCLCVWPLCKFTFGEEGGICMNQWMFECLYNITCTCSLSDPTHHTAIKHF